MQDVSSVVSPSSVSLLDTLSVGAVLLWSFICDDTNDRLQALPPIKAPMQIFGFPSAIFVYNAYPPFLPASQFVV